MTSLPPGETLLAVFDLQLQGLLPHSTRWFLFKKLGHRKSIFLLVYHFIVALKHLQHYSSNSFIRGSNPHFFEILRYRLVMVSNIISHSLPVCIILHMLNYSAVVIPLAYPPRGPQTPVMCFTNFLEFCTNWWQIDLHSFPSHLWYMITLETGTIELEIQSAMMFVLKGLWKRFHSFRADMLFLYCFLYHPNKLLQFVI